jgi:hypothetical protein
MIQIVKAEPRHASIVGYLRAADVDEIWASTGLSPAFSVAYSISHSPYARAVLVDRNPEVVFGVGEAVTPHGKIGVPWLVATDEIERHPVRFYRTSKTLMAGIREKYSCLVNWVDARNTLSIRWLKWLGFTIGEPEPWGVSGMPFHRFWWRGEPWNEQ